MTPLFLVYLIKVALSITLLMVLFKAVLAADQSFARNRFYLLLAMLWSVTIPIVSSVLSTETPLKALSSSFQVVLPAFTLSANGSEVQSDSWGEPYTIIITIYLTGVAIFLFRMMGAYLRVTYIVATSKPHKIENHTVRVTKQAIAPFAFFGWIVFPEKLIDHHDIAKMLLHERVHSRQLHALDLLLCELFAVFQWFNPASWMLKRLITENHEFTADRAVIDLGVSSYEYQASLVNATIGREVVPVSHFSLILIKKRILMINKKRNLNWLRIKSLFVPAAFVAALALTSFTVEMGANSVGSNQNSNAKNVASNMAQPDVKSATSPAPATTKPSQQEKVYDSVDQMPTYPGGLNAMMQFLSKNTVYPAEAAKNNIQGTVYVGFIVGKTGTISDVKIVKGANQLLDDEAVRVAKQMPSWAPGKQDGKNVAVQFVMPVKFVLEGATQPSDAGEKKILCVIADKEYLMNMADIDKVIKPENIASMNVLKGTQATKQFGEKAANGAIIIQLKQGSPELLKQLEVYGYR